MSETTPNIESKVLQIDYVEYWVGNAKLCSKFYSSAFGFHPIAVKGLETGEKQISSHVLVQGNATFVFTSTLRANHKEFNEYLGIHGDSIKDVALRVENVHAIFEHAVKNGAKVVEEPHVVKDERGYVTIAKIAAPYGDVVHTLIDRSKYNGLFLPGFKPSDALNTFNGFGVTHIDHIAIAYEKGKTLEVMHWYANCLGFSQFLCNDEDTNEGLTVNGMEGGLRTVVIASSPEQYSLKFVLVEALDRQEGKKQNQISEFIEFNGGISGVHHIALHTDDIITSVKLMKNRGVEFITVPSLYYEELFAKEGSFMKEKENQDQLQELGILMDISFKKNALKSPNFLYQTFTVPLQDRPTFFFEIISRKGSNGFGDRTIKALFEAIERLQDKRSVSD